MKKFLATVMLMFISILIGGGLLSGIVIIGGMFVRNTQLLSIVAILLGLFYSFISFFIMEKSFICQEETKNSEK